MGNRPNGHGVGVSFLGRGARAQGPGPWTQGLGPRARTSGPWPGNFVEELDKVMEVPWALYIGSLDS